MGKWVVEEGRLWLRCRRIKIMRAKRTWSETVERRRGRPTHVIYHVIILNERAHDMKSRMAGETFRVLVAAMKDQFGPVIPFSLMVVMTGCYGLIASVIVNLLFREDRTAEPGRVSCKESIAGFKVRYQHG